jgi:formamidopyrimidine-DNA glycosylase
MPELPEVDALRRALAPGMRGARIDRAVLRARICGGRFRPASRPASRAAGSVRSIGAANT